MADRSQYRVYASDEFQERLSIENRMPIMVDVALIPNEGRPGGDYVRYHRWRRSDLAAYLLAGRFRIWRQEKV